MFLGFVDLFAGLRVEVVALGGALGSHLVEFVAAVSKLASEFDQFAFRAVFEPFVGELDVIGVVELFDVVFVYYTHN